MTTPPYLGASQPGANPSDLLGRLGSYFGGGTPAYAGPAQLSPASTRAPHNSTPIYAPPPTQEPLPATACMCTAVPVETERSGCPIDPEALAAGQIAIVIPRQG